MTELALFAAVAGLLAFAWRSAVEARTLANAAAHDECARTGAQLLDGTVVFRSWRLRRGPGRRLTLVRDYVFEYTEDGASRRQGFVVVRGREVELVGLGPTLVQQGVA